jgi:PTS system D-glucosamine-specific IIC component
MVDGVLIEGAQNIFFAELASNNITHFSVSATRFMSGKFPLMIFGLPGAALAMYRMANPEKRKLAGGLLLSAALTSVLTGITEPIEFTFLFVAPVLYVIHCFFAGCAYMLMHIFGVGVGMTFSGGFIDLFLFGILQGNAKTSWFVVVLVGIVYFIVYYFLFSFLIKKFNFKTPGRDETEEVKLYRRADLEAAKGKKNSASNDDTISALIEQGLGGKANISDVDCCATRLRVTVFDSALVNEGTLKASGAAGVIKKGNGVQVIYGPQVTVIKSNLEDYLQNPNNIESTPITKTPTKTSSTIVSSGSETIYSPLEGSVMPLSKVEDGVFSEEMLGKGIAIEPTSNKVVSPVNGTISMVFETKHAIGISSKDGAEILIHIGIDTVQLNGKYFDVKVKSGDKIEVGDLLAEVDFDMIKKEGYRIITPVIIANTDNYKSISSLATDNVKHNDALIGIIK